MKKYLILTLTSMLIISMIGCGGTKTETQSESSSSSGQAVEATEPESKEVKASDKILSAGLYDNVIQVNNKVIELPAKVQDFLDAGVSIDSISEDYILEPADKKGVSLYMNDTKNTYIIVNPINYTDKQCPIKEAYVTEIESTKTKNVEMKDIFYSKGVTVGIPMAELKEKWGEPDYEDSTGSDITYYYGENLIKKDLKKEISKTYSATRNMYKVTIDRNAGTVKEISYHFSMAKPGEDPQKFVESNYKELKYNIPLCFNNKYSTDMGNNYLYEIDNQKYIISMSERPLQLGNVNCSYKDEDMKKAITTVIDFDCTKFEVLKSEDKEKWAYGYYVKTDKVRGNCIYYTEKNQYSTSFDLKPLNDGDQISDAAISKFEEIIKTYTSSMKETSKS